MTYFFKIKYQFWIALLVSVILIIVNVWKGADWYGEDLVSILTNILSSIFSGILVSIYFEITAKEQFRNEIVDLLSLNRLVADSGIQEYHLTWDSVDLSNYIKSAKKIDIYVYYGTSVFNAYQQYFQEFLSKKGNKLRVFLSHENNQFLKASADVWSINDLSYGYDNVKQKIGQTISIFTTIRRTLIARKMFRGSLKIYKVKSHPVPFSIYIFDKKMVLVMNKISHHKIPRPAVFVLNKTDTENSLYTKIKTDLDSLLDKKGTYVEKQVIP
jgi:hypothetical protein